MDKKEIWVEGSFAGELTVESRPAGYCDDEPFDDIEEEWEDEEQLEDEEPDEEDDWPELEDLFEPPRRKRSRNKEIGRRGERAAAKYLERMGYEILERNYECPFGEADLIVRDGESLVFVEVKTRSGVSKGFPSEAVDERKRGKYERIAGWYLSHFGETNIPVRFDIVAIMVIAEDRAFLRHYVNAFSVGL